MVVESSRRHGRRNLVSHYFLSKETMRNLTLLAIVGLVSATTAQSPLDMGLIVNNGGNPGGGLYFNLTVNSTVTITDVNFGIGANTALGASCSVNLWLGPSTYVGNVTDPSLWTLVGSTVPYIKTTAGGTAEIIPPGGAAVVPVGSIAAVTLAPGTYGFALESVGCNHGYVSGVGCIGTSPPGSCSNATGITTELELRGGFAQNAFLAGGVFSPRIYAGSIGYTAGGTPITFASRENYGFGCYKENQSWYEYYPNPGSNTLSNTSLLMTYNQAINTYTMTTGTTPIDTAALLAPPLLHGADGDIFIDTTTSPILYASAGNLQVATEVNMNADGFVTLQGSTPALWTGANIVADIFVNSVPALTTPGQVPASVGTFTFMDPSAGGTTHYDNTGTEHLFTWVDVPHTGGATNSFQIAIDLVGNIEMRWGTMSIGGGGGNPEVVGYILDNSVIGGSVPFQTAVPFDTEAVDSNPLHLEADVNPIIGTTVNLTTSDQDPNPGFGICFLATAGLTPGFDLAILGAPGCFANVNINTGPSFVIDSIGANGLAVAVALPNNVALVGQSLFCQSAWLKPTANAFGLISSNGVRLTVGSF
jgi:hypothetical protein